MYIYISIYTYIDIYICIYIYIYVYNITTQQHNNTTTQQHNNTTTQQHNFNVLIFVLEYEFQSAEIRTRQPIPITIIKTSN